MKRRRLMYAVHIVTAVIGAVFAVGMYHASRPGLGPVTYALFLLLPQLLLLLLKLHRVRNRYDLLRAAEGEYDPAPQTIRRSPQKTLLRFAAEPLHTYALEKSEGIHPNRAGPFPIFA